MEKNFSYHGKRGVLIVSHAIICIAIFSFPLSLITNSIDLTEQILLSFLSILFVCLPSILIVASIFDSVGEAISFRTDISWLKVNLVFLFTCMATLFLYVANENIVTNFIFQKIDSSVFGIVWVILMIFFIKKLKDYNLREMLFPFLKSNEDFKKSFFILMYLYIFLIFIFAGIYFNLHAQINLPKDVSKLSFWHALYFSAITLTSTGYGDFTPTGLARFFASLQAILGTLYFPFCLSYFWSKYSQR